MSAMPSGPAGWPEPASASISMMVCRIAFARFESASACSSVSGSIYLLYRIFGESEEFLVRICGILRFHNGGADAEAARSRARKRSDVFFRNAAVDFDDEVWVRRAQFFDSVDNARIVRGSLITERRDAHTLHDAACGDDRLDDLKWCIEKNGE